jgi:hypothetical protein
MHEAVEEMAKDWQAKQARLTAAGDGADGGADAEATEQQRRVTEAVELRDLIKKMRAGDVVETGAIIKFSRLFKVRPATRRQRGGGGLGRARARADGRT